jgi:hypothetical protein
MLGKFTPLAVLLGFAIAAKMSSWPEIARFLRMLGALGLVILTGIFASLLLIGTCLLPLELNFCGPRQLWSAIFSNFTFPLIFVLGWGVIEILQAIRKWLNYLSIKRKTRNIR